MAKYLQIFILFFSVSGLAQENNPLEYMEQINDAYTPVITRQFDFAFALAQGQPADLVEKQRRVLLAEIRDARSDISRMPPFRGNRALRDSTVAFLDITYNLVNEDYAKIVQLEPAAESGVNEMESFLNAQQAAYARISHAAQGLKRSESDFARQFGVRLVDSDDKFARRLEELNRTFSYYNQVYITFFRAYQQELKLFEAIGQKDFEAMKREQKSLADISASGLSALSRMGSYNGDRSLRAAARDNLEFYRQESEIVEREMISYYSALQKLQQLKVSLDTGGLSAEQKAERSKSYNEQVKLVNNATPRLNEVNSSLNLRRAENLDAWNNISEAFLQKYID